VHGRADSNEAGDERKQGQQVAEHRLYIRRLARQVYRQCIGTRAAQHFIVPC
jgi:hypothetical protein